MKKFDFKSLAPVLLCFVLSMVTLGPVAWAQEEPTPIPTAPPRKVETAGQLLKRRIVDLKVDNPTQYNSIFNKERRKEIDADISVAYRLVGSEDDMVLKPFWMGQSGFLASGKIVGTDGIARDIYNPQQYLWTVVDQPIIPMEGPRQTNPSRLVEFGYDLGAVFHEVYDVAGGIQAPWWVAEPFKAVWDGGGTIAADGRPMDELRTSISGPKKHFYWNFGEFRNPAGGQTYTEFPKITTTRVVITGEDEASGAHDAEVTINWHLPRRIVFHVEMGLWNWVEQEDAPLTSVQEFWDKLIDDQEFQKEVVKDIGLQVVDFGITKVGGKVVMRVVVIAEKPLKAVARKLTESARKVLLRRKVLPNGTLQPHPSWYKETKIRTKASDRAPKRPKKPKPEFDPDLPDGDSGAEPTPTPEPTTPEDAEKQQDKEDDKDEDDHEEYIEPPIFYLYTIRPGNIAADYWTNPNSRGTWPAGHYLTDLKPEECTQLRKGQLSFAMFGHPYSWGDGGGSVSWVEINVGEIRDNNGNLLLSKLNYRSQAFQKLAPAPPGFLSLMSRRKIFIVQGDWDYGRNFDPRRLTLGPGSVPLLPNIDGSPGIADVPPNTDTNTYPATGVWLDPSTGLPWTDPATGQPLPPEGFDPVTGLQRRANSDWQPPAGSNAALVTGGQPIKFRYGYPIFSPWAKFTAQLKVPIEPMRGDTYHDFNEADDQYAEVQQPPETRSWAQSQRRTRIVRDPSGQIITPPREPNWTWHHHADMRSMLFVPSMLNTLGPHGGIPHAGGAQRQLAPASRW